MADFVIRMNDRLPEITATLKDYLGVAVDLSPLGTAVKFHMRAPAGGTAKVNASASIVNGLAGQVKYIWASGDTDTAGSYLAEWEVTFSDTRKQTFPNPGYLQISVTDELA